MRVAIFTDTYVPEINGVAMSSKSLRDILIAHGHEVLVVTTNPFGDEFNMEDNVYRVPGQELKKLYGYRLVNILNRKPMEVLRKFDPDVVHIQTEYTIGILGVMAAKSLRLPMVS